MSTTLNKASVPQINPQLLEQLQIAFPAPEVLPGKSMDQLQYEAGAHSVVEWIKSRIGSK